MKILSPKYATLEEQEFATGDINRLFRKYAVPGVIGLLFVGIQTMIDGAIVGNYVGANALASVNLVMPAYSLITALAIVVGIGCQTVVNISLGRGERQNANNALTTALVSLSIISVIFSLLFIVFSGDTARLLGANDVLEEDSTAYLSYLAPFFPVLATMFLGDYMMKALGRPYFAMIALGGTIVLNIALDFLFIVGFDMGVAGAGLATGLAFSCGAVFVIPKLFSRTGSVSVRNGRVRLKLLWQMLYNGSSEGVSEMSAGITMFMFNRAMVFYLGAAGVAAFTSINYIMFIGIIMFIGVSDGIIPLMSYNYGASRWSRVFKLLRIALITNVTVGVVLFILVFFGGEHIVKLFFNSNTADGAAAVAIAAKGAKIFAFAFLINGTNVLMSSFFTSLGDARTSIIISLMRGLICIVAGITIYPQIMGINGIWLTVPTAELITLILAICLFRRRMRSIYFLRKSAR